MPNKIVCIVGMTGSGKTVVSNFFAKKGYHYLRFGQITLDELKKRVGLASSPKIEKEIRENLREKHGPAAFAILNKPKIDALLLKGNIVVDGLYSWSEYKYLKEKYNEKIIIIAVHAKPELRYKRVAERKNIDNKMINRPFSKKEAKKRDYDEIEKIEKGGPIAMADFVIINTGTMQDLEKKVDKILLRII